MRNHAFLFFLIHVIVFGFLASTLYAVKPASKDLVVFPDGSKFYGIMLNGKKHGPARFVWPDGSEYRGIFMDNGPDGEGIYISAEGRRKKVIHKQGKLIKSQTISNAIRKKERVFGEFFSSGRYTGWYKGDRMKGFIQQDRGTMRYVNGSVYTGQWKDGQMHGNGIIRWDDGSVYSGQWLHGKRTGCGTYIWTNGDKYVGQWKENQMCGKGMFYHKDGSIEVGVWKEKTVYYSK